MKERIYVIYDKADEREVLVKAPNRARAIKRLTEDRFIIKPATAEDVLRVTDYGGESLFSEGKAESQMATVSGSGGLKAGPEAA